MGGLAFEEQRLVRDGAITTIQSLVLAELGPDLLARARPDAPERLAMAYCWQVRRLTLLGVRPRFEADRIAYCPLIGPPLLLLRPLERRHGVTGIGLRLAVAGGLAVEPGSASTLSLRLEPAGERLRARIELREYRPPGSKLPGFSLLYDQPQRLVHHLHARAFFGWLARHWRELAEPW